MRSTIFKFNPFAGVLAGDSEPHAANWPLILRVILKATALFILLNAVFVLSNPNGFSTTLSIYNSIVPGRERLPYGEDARSYNLSMIDLNAMFASHVVSAPKPANEFRVLLIGDSATWGILLHPEETLAGQINAANLTLADGRRLRAYNLGHPVLSLTKDVLILDQAMHYQPDMIIWLVTLQSFDRSRQIDAPLVRHNLPRVASLAERFGDLLSINLSDPRFITLSFWDQTILGQRRQIADWMRLQLYGVTWATTGVDQYYPPTYTPRANDFADEGLLTWGGDASPTTWTAEDIALNLIQVGHELTGDIPLLIVNEPIYAADGQNSDQRYNAWYPRWAYDAYRELLGQQAAEHGWHYVDLWDLIAPVEFTDSPVHLTPTGSALLAERLNAVITQHLENLD